MMKTSFRNSHLSQRSHDRVKVDRHHVRRLDSERERKYFSYCRVSGERKIETFLPAGTNPTSEHDASSSVDQKRGEGGTYRGVSELIDIIASPRDMSIRCVLLFFFFFYCARRTILSLTKFHCDRRKSFGEYMSEPLK